LNSGGERPDVSSRFRLRIPTLIFFSRRNFLCVYSLLKFEFLFYAGGKRLRNKKSFITQEFHGVILISVMIYVAEYYLVNRNTKITVRGAILYHKEEDLDREENILVIFHTNCFLLGYPKRPQRRKIWEKLVWKIPGSKILVEKVGKEKEENKRTFMNSIISKDRKVTKVEMEMIRSKLVLLYYVKDLDIWLKEL